MLRAGRYIFRRQTKDVRPMSKLPIDQMRDESMKKHSLASIVIYIFQEVPQLLSSIRVDTKSALADQRKIISSSQVVPVLEGLAQ